MASTPNLDAHNTRMSTTTQLVRTPCLFHVINPGVDHHCAASVSVLFQSKASNRRLRCKSARLERRLAQKHLAEILHTAIQHPRMLAIVVGLCAHTAMSALDLDERANADRQNQHIRLWYHLPGVAAAGNMTTSFVPAALDVLVLAECSPPLLVLQDSSPQRSRRVEATKAGMYHRGRQDAAAVGAHNQSNEFLGPLRAAETQVAGERQLVCERHVQTSWAATCDRHLPAATVRKG